MPKPLYLEAGEIVGTHGVHGELRVQPWCDSPALFATLTTLYWDKGQTPLLVKSRPHKQMALTKIEGIDTVQEAAALRGKRLYLHRDDLPLPAGRYFIQDLIGMRVVDADNDTLYGEIVDVSDTGVNNVYHMRMGKKEVLIPAIPDVVISVDLDTDIIRLRPMEGLFDDED